MSENIALDVLPGTSDSKGKDGKSISAALFQQHYFEHTMDWDFQNIWQWDSAKGQPVLQSVGVGAKMSGSHRNRTGHQADEDLLAQQMNANIWL